MYPKSVQTIADQLDAKGLTWKSYQEDIGNSATEPKTCRHPVIGQGDPTLIRARATCTRRVTTRSCTSTP